MAGGFGGGGFPVGGGGLGIGTVIVLGLIGWALGIDPSILIGGAELINGGSHYQRAKSSRRHRRTGNADRPDRPFRRRRARQYRGHLERDFPGQRPAVSPAAAAALFAGAEQRRLRLRAGGDGSVLLPDRPAHLSRHFVFPRHAGPLPWLQRQGLRICRGLCDRARGRPSRAEPARHFAEGARRRSTPPAARQRRTASRCESNCRPTVSPASGRNHSNQRWNSIEPGDVEAALQTASAIGDDRLQQQTRGYVVPDAFTHGTSAAAPALVHHGAERGQGVGLRYFCGGTVVRKPKMPGIDDSRQFVPLKIAVLTVSDTRERADDKSGALAGRAHPRRRPYARRARDRQGRRQGDPPAREGLDRGQVHRRGDHHRRHRLHRPRRDAGSGRAAVREEDGRLFRPCSCW